LKNLESAGLLISRRRGNLKYYLLDRKFPIYDELRSIILKTKGAAGLLAQCLSGMEKIDYAFIYGSFAAGQEVAKSDIDLMVIGDVTLEELIRRLKEPEIALGREIQPSLFGLREVRKRLWAKDAFLTRLTKEPKIMLIGEEDGLRGIAKKRSDKTV
jgi:predicted nucleotidyltransferase